MSLVVPITAAISAIQALLKYRARVDEILALGEATKALPFRLPPVPFDFDEIEDDLLGFFASDQGKLVLEFQERVDDYETFAAAPRSQPNFKLRQEFARLFFEASNRAPVLLGPNTKVPVVRPDDELQLSYYVVESVRLSRNSTLARLLLATADTLLEVGGANAGLFVSNPKTRAIVETVIYEFAGKNDLDDLGSREILEKLLSSAVVAAIENQQSISDEPAVVALFGALADLRKDLGNDFVAKILTTRGFSTLVGTYLTKVAEDPEILGDEGPFRTILAATLKDLGKNLTEIVDDPKLLLGVLEVALTTAAGEAATILEKKVRGKPLLSAVLRSILAELEKQGENDELLKSFVDGEILGDAFRASMSAIASSSGALATAAKVDRLSAELIAGIAQVLSQTQLNEVLSRSTLRGVLSTSLEALAERSDSWAGKNDFVNRLAAGVLGAAASAIEDGLSKSDLADLLDAAIETTTANLTLLELDSRLEALLQAFGQSLSSAGVRALLSPKQRRDLILDGLATAARNPKIWKGFGEKDLVQPLVVAVFEGLAADKTGLLNGETLVRGLRAVLQAAALRGRKLIDSEVEPAELKSLLELAMKRLENEIGREIDGENLPDYLNRFVAYFLADPFRPEGVDDPEFVDLHELAMERAELVSEGENP